MVAKTDTPAASTIRNRRARERRRNGLQCVMLRLNREAVAFLQRHGFMKAGQGWDDADAERAFYELMNGYSLALAPAANRREPAGSPAQPEPGGSVTATLSIPPAAMEALAEMGFLTGDTPREVSAAVRAVIIAATRAGITAETDAAIRRRGN